MGQGKKILSPYVVVNGTSLSSSFQSNPTSIEYMDRCSIEILCTGTPTGTVTVQGSVDYIEPNRTLNPKVSPANWFDLPLNLVALSGSDQNYFIDIGETGIRFLRITYTRTGGTGSMTAVISAKES